MTSASTQVGALSRSLARPVRVPALRGDWASSMLPSGPLLLFPPAGPDEIAVRRFPSAPAPPLMLCLTHVSATFVTLWVKVCSTVYDGADAPSAAGAVSSWSGWGPSGVARSRRIALTP